MTPEQISLLVEAIALSNLDKQIQDLVIASYSCQSKEGRKRIKAAIDKATQKTRKLTAERMRRQAGLI